MSEKIIDVFRLVGHLTFQCRNFLQANPSKAVVLDVSSTSSPSSDDDTPLQQLTRGKYFISSRPNNHPFLSTEEINRDKQQGTKKDSDASSKSKKQEKSKRKRQYGFDDLTSIDEMNMFPFVLLQSITKHK